MPLLRANANPGTATWVDNYADNLTISGNITSTGDNAFSGTNSGLRTVQGTTETADSTLDAGGTPYTLTVADSGGTFLINAAAAITINIPTAAAANAGVAYRFVLSANAAVGNSRVQSGAADLIGTIVDSTATVDQVTAVAGINFLSAVPAVIGDNLEVYSNGQNWMVRAVSSTNSGITAT
jgi:hypothetical protein